jgi:hypothetical protein
VCAGCDTTSEYIRAFANRYTFAYEYAATDKDAHPTYSHSNGYANSNCFG